MFKQQDIISELRCSINTVIKNGRYGSKKGGGRIDIHPREDTTRLDTDVKPVAIMLDGSRLWSFNERIE
jgi:hypothetical protein